jgi:hypothetical protein
MKIQNLLEHRENITLLESFGLPKDDYNIRWMTEVHPLLMEVALAPDQVKQLLKSIETTAGEMGQNRTMAGKAVDTAGEISKKVKDLWFNKLGSALQQSGPVKAFDAKYEEIKSKIAAENPKLAEAFGKYKQFADNNPKLQKFLLMVATSAAAALGLAVVGGAAAGIAATGLGVGAATAIVQIADRLLKGEKASTAIGRGGTAGIVAGLTAAGVKAAGDLITAGMDALKGQGNEIVFQDNIFKVTPEDMERVKDAFDNYQSVAGDAIGNPAELVNVIDSPEAKAYFDLMKELAQKAATDPEYQQAAFDAAVGIASKNLSIDQMVVNAQEVLKAVTPVAAAAAGQAAGGAGEKEKKESYYVQRRPLSEGQVYLLLKRVSQQEQLTEGPMDMLKKGAGAVAGAVGKGLSGVGKQITNKNTYEKLWASWKLEGSPTDSEELAKFLKGQGVSDEVVAKVYGDMKIPAPGSAPSTAVDIETVKQMIVKLPVDRKARLLTYLLGGKKAMKQPAAAPEEDNPNIVKGTESKIPRGQKL